MTAFVGLLRSSSGSTGLRGLLSARPLPSVRNLPIGGYYSIRQNLNAHLSSSAGRMHPKPPLPIVNPPPSPGPTIDAEGRVQRSSRDRDRRKKNDGLALNKPPSHSPYINKGLVTRIISIDSIRKPTSAGRVNRFRAVVVSGNGNGAGGFGLGKGLTVRAAIQKAKEQAKKSWVAIELREDGGLYHDVKGKYNNTKVLLRSSKPFNGLTAGGVVRGVCECFGIHHSTTKVFGRTTATSVVCATLHALSQHRSPVETQELRGQKLYRSNRWVY